LSENIFQTDEKNYCKVSQNSFRESANIKHGRFIDFIENNAPLRLVYTWA